MRMSCKGKTGDRGSLQEGEMRNVRWLAAAVLVASTTGCVESVNQGYGYNGGGYNNGYSSGYSNAYYPSSSGYYSQPARVNN